MKRDEPEENIGGNRVEHIKDAIPFQEKLVASRSLRERIQFVRIPELDELTVRVINPRKPR